MREVTAISAALFNRNNLQPSISDLPGGDQQVVGGLQDLTMLGIKGNINELRPTDGSGPDYFIQAIFLLEALTLSD